MTALPLSVESQLRARLDFAHDWHCDRDTSLTRHCGSSSLAPAIATGISRMDRDVAQRRVTRTRRAPDTRLYGYWTPEERKQHSERMREYYGGRKAALAKARRAAKQQAKGITPGSPWEPKGGRGSA